MSEKKTILLNESFMTTGNKTMKKKSGRKPKKEKPKTIIKPNKLKKDLLERIKKHQQKNQMIKQISPINNDENNDNNNDNNSEKKRTDFHNDFMSSLEYLNKVSEKRKSEKNKKRKSNRHKPKTLKHRSTNSGGSLHSQINPIQNDPFVAIDLPTDFDTNKSSIIHLSNVSNNNPISNNIVTTNNVRENTIKFNTQHTQNSQNSQNTQNSQHTQSMSNFIIKPDPNYGCLKGGTKPTYRQLHNKTLKLPPKTSNTINATTRQSALKQLKKKHKKLRQKTRKTRKTKYTLGRNNNSNKLSVLIKNNSTRRKIKKEHGLLKQKPLSEIKKYLYERNLLKIGSSAPNDVIRTLYEYSVLSGEINNLSGDVSLHNFVTND